MYILCSDASFKLSFSSSITAYKYGRLHQNRYSLCVKNIKLLVVWHLCILYGKPHNVINGNTYLKYRETQQWILNMQPGASSLFIKLECYITTIITEKRNHFGFDFKTNQHGFWMCIYYWCTPMAKPTKSSYCNVAWPCIARSLVRKPSIRGGKNVFTRVSL